MSLRPVVGIEIPEHLQPGKVEHRQGSPAVNLPSGETDRNCTLNRAQVFLWKLFRVELRKNKGVIVRQSYRNRSVELHFILPDAKCILVGIRFPVDGAFLQGNWQSVERGKMGLVAVSCLIPFEKTKGDVERIGSALLYHGPGDPVEIAEPGFQNIRIVQGLEL